MNNEENIALYAFRTFGDTVLRAAYACCGSFAEAEDITQDVFLLEALQDAQHHQERTEGVPVDIPEQLRGGRRDDQCDSGSQERQCQHQFLFQETEELFHFLQSFQLPFRMETALF